jgi:hypothetical protein
VKQLCCSSFISLVGLCSMGCATVAPPASQTGLQLRADASCRELSAPDGKTQKYCGSAEQWAEFDRRIALIQAGVTCRWANTSHELCLNASQWKTYELRRSSVSDAASMVQMRPTGGPYDNGVSSSMFGPVSMDPVNLGR